MSVCPPEFTANQPLKIAMYNVTTAARIGGVESFVWGASAALARMGHGVDVFSGRGDYVESLPDGARAFFFPFTRREKIPDLGNRFRKLGERLSFARRALPRVIRGKYDILHIHKPYDLPAAALAKRFSGVKVLLGCQGRDFFLTDRLWFRSVDGAVSCSEFNARQVEERYGLLPTVVYNGVDTEKFRPLPADDELRATLGIRGQERVLLYVGRLIGWKGVGDLISSLPGIVQRETGVRLLIVGDGEQRRNLVNIGRELGLSDHIVFAGAVPNEKLPRYLSLGDVFVLPSVADETFGISLCEAMSCGLPVVATRVGGIPEVVSDGVSGFLAEPRDPAGMAEKISLLLHNREVARRMGEEGRRRVLEKFSWDRVACSLENEYRKLLGPHSSLDGEEGGSARRLPVRSTPTGARGAGGGEGGPSRKEGSEAL